MGEAGLMNLRKGRRGCGNDWGGAWEGGLSCGMRGGKMRTNRKEKKKTAQKQNENKATFALLHSMMIKVPTAMMKMMFP